MYVTNDSITTRFETMSNKELGAFIRAELKKVGITSRMVSTRVSDCGYSTSVDCYIKDLSVEEIDEEDKTIGNLLFFN